MHMSYVGVERIYVLLTLARFDSNNTGEIDEQQRQLKGGALVAGPNPNPHPTLTLSLTLTLTLTLALALALVLTLALSLSLTLSRCC